MTRVVFLMSMGNWSVSHPRSGEPVFASTEPNIPNLPTTGGGRGGRGVSLDVTANANGRLARAGAGGAHAEAMTMSCS